MPAKPTKQRLLEAGIGMLLERGFHNLGIQALLDETGIPKGSFYHYFETKEEYGLQCIDLYMENVHQALDQCLGNAARPPLQRVRDFFEATRESYRGDGYLGCLLGGLGQELSGVSEAFRAKVEACLSAIAMRISETLEVARAQGDLPSETDPTAMAHLLVNCWEGAALRCRMTRNPAPLGAMLDFYFRAAGAR